MLIMRLGLVAGVLAHRGLSNVPPSIPSKPVKDWPWTAGVSYTHSVDDTDERLSSMKSLRGTNSTIAAFADFNGDGYSDMLFLVEEDGVRLEIHCALKYKTSGFSICLNQTLESPRVVPSVSNVSTVSTPSPLGMIPGSFTQDGTLSFVLLTPVKSADKSPDKSTDNLSLALYTLNSTNHFALRWHSQQSITSVVPIAVDINRDGFHDLLTHDSQTEQRVVWINQRGKSFKAVPWESLGAYIDLKAYSSLPKADLTAALSSNDYLNSSVSNSFELNASLGKVVPINEEKSSSVFGFIKNVLHKMGIGGSEDDADDGGSLEEHFLRLHESDVHFSSRTEFRWSPRPLPLDTPPVLAPHIGYANLDIDGNCVADLILVVQSPDFEGRYELEIWLTETNPNTDEVKWKQWRGQRVLLPEGTQSIALNDFSNNGGPDLLVVACDPLSLDYDEEPPYQDVTCQGSERVYLFKLFHPPLCVSPQLMPAIGNGACRPIDDLCSRRPFAYGGIDEGLRRVGVSVSDIRLPEEIGDTHLVASTRFPAITRTADVDRDGFEDLLLLVSSSKTGLGLRYLKSVVPSGESNWQLQSSLNTMKQMMIVTAVWDSGSPWQDNIKRVIESAWTSTKVFMQTIAERLLGRNRPFLNPLKARRFEAIETLTPENSNATLYAGGFIENFDHPGTLNLLTFSHSPDPNASQVHLFHREDLGLRSFSMSSVADANFFLSATLLEPIDDSCRKGELVQPALGSSFALAITGLDGTRYPVRKGRSTHGGVLGVLRPRATYVGLGQASNYIESLFVGSPYASEAPPSCLDANATGTVRRFLLEQDLEDDVKAADTCVLDSFYRRWVAIIPNSEITVAPGSKRSRPDKWTLSLSVNPGKQAFAIVIGTCICLGAVGSIIMVLDQIEKAALSKEHQGFRRHFITV